MTELEYKVAEINAEGVIFLPPEEMEEFLHKLEISEVELTEDNSCPECGSFLEIIQGHCKTCYNCGWSVCGL